MKLTPLDIRKQEFNRQIRGCDPDQVHSFLEMVADAFEQLQSENQELKKEQKFLEMKLEEYRQMESSLQEAVVNAQKAGKEAEQTSAKNTQVIVQKAELEADQIVQQARRKKQELLDEIAQLEGQRRSFLLKMKQILRGQVELLEILEQESPERDSYSGNDRA